MAASCLLSDRVQFLSALPVSDLGAWWFFSQGLASEYQSADDGDKFRLQRELESFFADGIRK